MAYKPFKMKGHTLPGINQKSEGDTDTPDGRSGSSAFQYKKSPAKAKEKTGMSKEKKPGMMKGKKPVDPNINPETGFYYPKPGGAEGNKPKMRNWKFL